MPSVMQRVGTPNARHNLDNEYRKHLDHVDPELSQHNETVRHRAIEDIYWEKLQPSFTAFNERQKRRNRRLDVKWHCTNALDYQRALDKAAQASSNPIDKKGRPPIREIVWQIGNPEQGFGCKDQTPEHRSEVKAMLLECQAEAERRYPQFAWGDIVFHADEVSHDANDQEHGSLHLHAAFVPLCLQNKQGPAVQVAFERCLREMGYPTFEAWKHDLDQIMEDVLQRHGLQRTVMGNHEHHQDATEFHRQQAVIRQTKEYEKQMEVAKGELEAAQEDLAEAHEMAETELDVAQEASHAASEALLEAQMLQKDIDGLKREKNALEDDLETLQEALQERQDIQEDIFTLQEKKTTLEHDLKVLQSSITETSARAVALEASTAHLERALKEKIQEAIDRGWSINQVKERIASIRDGDRREQTRALVDRFLDLPSVQPLWEAFLRDQTRGRGVKDKPKSNDGPVL